MYIFVKKDANLKLGTYINQEKKHLLIFKVEFTPQDKLNGPREHGSQTTKCMLNKFC